MGFELFKRRRRRRPSRPARRCRTVRDRRGRRRRVCRPRTPPRRTPRPVAPVPRPRPGQPVPTAAAPPVVTASPPPTTPGPQPAPAQPPAPQAPAPGPQGPATTAPPSPSLPAGARPDTPVQQGWGRREAERLCWRAGFGPRPGDVDRLAAMTPEEAVRTFTRPSGAAQLTPDVAPHVQNGSPLAPDQAWGHDHLHWLDRMVRSDQQLVERMALIWHDWWATTRADVDEPALLIAQVDRFRRHALGSFHDLALDITSDPAMLVFLNGIENTRRRPNENYARELMELFTLGADRGAYTETDVRELARALTGWDADWSDGWVNFRYDPARHDATDKTVFGRRGAWTWEDAVRLCLDHPLHPSFLVRKLWSYFVPTAPGEATQAALERHYVASGFRVGPLVEAILLHPDLYAGPVMVKPPVVFCAGVMRARERTVDHDWFWWFASDSGQRLYLPPNVSGWNDQGWLDTSTLRGRWRLVSTVVDRGRAEPDGYDPAESPQLALERALQWWGNPSITEETRAELERFAAAAIPPAPASWEHPHLRANRQNALRHLIATCPDANTC